MIYRYVWHARFLGKLKSYFISTFGGMFAQNYPVNAGVRQGSIFGPPLFLLYFNDLPDDVICKIAIYADDTTLYSMCNQASDFWQQLEFDTELKSDL